MDNQLKKKSTEADRNSLLLEQLRAKQERIHELEMQFSKVERQSTSERQTHDKQAHETWLQMRKVERELKDARAELSTIKERLAEKESNLKAVQSENQLLKQNLGKMQSVGYYIASPARRGLEEAASVIQNQNESMTGGPLLTDQLQIDTNAAVQNGHSHDSRPPSNASSSSGGVNQHMSSKNQYPPTQVSPFPMLYSQPSPSSCSLPNVPPMPVMPPLPPYQSPQHIMMMKMMMHQQQNYQKHLANMVAAKSSSSPRSQISPHNIAYSASFPNGNSTSLLNGKFFF